MSSEIDREEMGRELEVMGMYMLAVGAPFLLVLVNVVIPVTYVSEELVKLLVIVGLVRILGGRAMKWQYAGLVGLLFGMTETVLYSMNVLTYGVYEGLLWRSLITVPMHAMTAVVIFLIGRSSGWRYVLGFGVAVVLHGAFNLL